RTMLGRTSSSILMAASPLLTSTILNCESAKVCVTRRRIVVLSSARRIVLRIIVKKGGLEVRPERLVTLPVQGFFAGALFAGVTLKPPLPFPLPPEFVFGLAVTPPRTGVGAVSARWSSGTAELAAPVSVGTGGRDLKIPNIFPRMFLSSRGACCARASATGFGSGIG